VPRLVPAYQPYDARRMLWFLGRHSTPGLETYDESTGSPTYTRALRLPGGPGVLQLTLSGGGSGFDADLRLSRAEDEPAALAQLAHLLDLETDPNPALAHLVDDPVVQARRRPGVRVPGTVDPVETLVGTVIGQQISLAGARTLSGRLVRTYGKPLPRRLVRAGVTHAFPTPEALAALDPAQLPMPLARGRTLAAIGHAVVQHGESLVGGAADAEPALLALPGVGPWTATYQRLRAGRDPDAFMATDLAVRRAFEAHGLAGDPRSAAAHALAWSPYRSLALLHLWFGYLERGSRVPPLSVVAGTLEP
jgi:AraC family transcriptional regulator, regulatory protein of adaptative response / DNA-3-methyladenine glycosylase II